MLGAEIRPILRRLRLPEPLVSLLACASAPVELVFGTTNHYSSMSAVALGRGANEVKQKAAKIAKKRISNMGCDGLSPLEQTARRIHDLICELRRSPLRSLHC